MSMRLGRRSGPRSTMPSRQRGDTEFSPADCAFANQTSLDVWYAMVVLSNVCYRLVSSAYYEGPIVRASHPVDHHLGARVRLARAERGISQTALGESIGVTFQQIQKYERGTNR